MNYFVCYTTILSFFCYTTILSYPVESQSLFSRATLEVERSAQNNYNALAEMQLTALDAERPRRDADKDVPPSPERDWPSRLGGHRK